MPPQQSKHTIAVITVEKPNATGPADGCLLKRNAAIQEPIVVEPIANQPNNTIFISVSVGNPRINSSSSIIIDTPCTHNPDMGCLLMQSI